MLPISSFDSKSNLLVHFLMLGLRFGVLKLQAVIKQFGGTGYESSDIMVIDEVEMQRHQQLEKLYRSTRAGKVHMIFVYFVDFEFKTMANTIVLVNVVIGMSELIFVDYAFHLY